MSAILKFDFQKRKQLRFPEVNYLNKLHKKDQILHVATTFSLKQYEQGETRTSHGPIPHPLKPLNEAKLRYSPTKQGTSCTGSF